MGSGASCADGTVTRGRDLVKDSWRVKSVLVRQLLARLVNGSGPDGTGRAFSARRGRADLAGRNWCHARGEQEPVGPDHPVAQIGSPLVLAGHA
jgi:hypothetical protein